MSGRRDMTAHGGVFRRAVRRLRSQGGQTFILVMTVTALATVLGIMAMSGALMSLRLRGMKRVSDKNFYRLELAAAEIRAGAARDAATAGGEDGASSASGAALTSDGMDGTDLVSDGTDSAGSPGTMGTAAAAADADAWRERFLTECMGLRDLSVLSPENAARMNTRREAAKTSAAAWLMGFSVTIPTTGTKTPVADRTEELAVTVGDITTDAATGGVLLSDVSMVLINYERDAQSEVVCDLLIVPPQEAGTFDGVVRTTNWRRIG